MRKFHGYVHSIRSLHHGHIELHSHVASIQRCCRLFRCLLLLMTPVPLPFVHLFSNAFLVFASSRRSCVENKNAEYKTKDVELVNVLCSSVCVWCFSFAYFCRYLYHLVPSLYQDMPSCTSASLARCSSLGGWKTWHCTSCRHCRPRESMITQGKTV